MGALTPCKLPVQDWLIGSQTLIFCRAQCSDMGFACWQPRQQFIDPYVQQPFSIKLCLQYLKLQMEKYKTIKKLGSGAFGHVEKAQNTETKEIVAIKKLKKKYSTWEECLQLAEVKALRKLQHPHIIKLKEVVRVKDQAYFVFEYIEKDLYQLCQQRKEKGKPFQESQIKNMAYQVVQALNYIHKSGFFHRDLKPENLLVSQDNTTKLIDFGLAKEVRSKPPFTDYVSTRWYRAPEIMLKFATYSTPVDIFAFGCVLAEMYLMKPLFMGNSQIDQLNKICSVLGTPTAKDWPEGIKLAAQKGYNFPQYSAIGLENVIPGCSSEGLNLIEECLRFDPSKRITMQKILKHPYFMDFKMEIKQIEVKEENPFQKIGQRLGLSIEKTPQKQEVSPPKSAFHDISEHEFDQILKNLSQKKSQSPLKLHKVNHAVEEPISQFKPTRVEESQPKKQEQKAPFSYSLAARLQNRLDGRGDSETKYGGYTPSFGQPEPRKNFSSLGMFGLSSMKR